MVYRFATFLISTIVLVSSQVVKNTQNIYHLDGEFGSAYIEENSNLQIIVASTPSTGYMWIAKEPGVVGDFYVENQIGSVVKSAGIPGQAGE
jgi:hypothetical protein